MSGHFELISAPDGGYRFQLIGKSGELVAMSVKFPSKRAAAAGIYRVGEIAGTGLIRDLTESRRGEPSHRIRPSQPVPVHTGTQRVRARAAHPHLDLEHAQIGSSVH
ncbi:YegP family protein [Arthrobacter oryzae]|uniref:YegP family protein n=1 Tax=Arthrobacter oryzae TaxID=409290 RepID=UPI00273CE2DB|nr:DUF1508 domain-containing protein [Arthrobacter oryzae]WLQ07554.1 DUF1508 domain-containing protein [Arthrobacter oryzae]